jgi:hypothetical protein
MKVEGANEDDRLFDQIKKWASGHSLHNETDDWCCPDFSCCIKEIDTPADQRQEYLRLFTEQGVEGIVSMMETFTANAILHSKNQEELLNALIQKKPNTLQNGVD